MLTHATGTTPRDLGPEIMRARVLTGYESARQMVGGFAWILYFIVGPFISFPYVSLMVAAGSLGFEFNRSLVARLLFFSVFTIVYALLFWYQYLLPRRDYFVLHECGIAICMKFRRARISSSSMAQFYSGRAPSAFESISLFINRIFHPAIADLADKARRTGLTIVLKNGRKEVFKGLLVRFDSSDVASIFAELIQRYPHLNTKETDDGTYAEI